MKKNYLVEITHASGATLHIGAYCDIYGDKYFRVYYCGADTGRRFAKIGNAARYLETVAAQWHTDRKTYGTAATIPTTGTPHNIALYNYYFNGGDFPTATA